MSAQPNAPATLLPKNARDLSGPYLEELRLREQLQCSERELDELEKELSAIESELEAQIEDKRRYHVVEALVHCAHRLLQRVGRAPDDHVGTNDTGCL